MDSSFDDTAAFGQKPFSNFDLNNASSAAAYRNSFLDTNSVGSAGSQSNFGCYRNAPGDFGGSENVHSAGGQAAFRAKNDDKSSRSAVQSRQDPSATTQNSSVTHAAQPGPPVNIGHISQQLENAARMLPTAQDSSKIYKSFLSYLNPVVTPNYYPTTVCSEIFNLETYQKFNPELLFTLFYRCEGRLAQKLAARALKQQSWRFHTEFKTWFQRLEEPKVMTQAPS